MYSCGFDGDSGHWDVEGVVTAFGSHCDSLVIRGLDMGLNGLGMRFGAF